MSAALSMTDAMEVLGDDAVDGSFRRACWRTGLLRYHCSEVQLRAADLVDIGVRRVVWETSRRFGKTRTCVVVSGEWCLAFPGVRIPYAAPTATQVRTFVHPHMLELSSHAPDDIAPELIAGEWVFPPLQWYDAAGNPTRTLLDGGQYLARYKGKRADELLRQSRVSPHGCEDRKKADALRGTGTVGAIVDEARDIPILRYVLSSVLGPMLWEARSKWSDDVDPVMLVASTPADSPDHPFPEVADAAQAKGAYFHATVYDCDHLSDRDIADAIEEAGGEDTVAWQVEGLAQRVRDPSTVAFPEFSRAEHVREVARPEHYLPAVIGDGGHVDLSVYAFGYYDFERRLYVIEGERVYRRTRSDVADRGIAALERELWGDTTVDRRRVDAPPQVRADMNREEWGDPSEWGDDRTAPHWQAVTKPRGARRLGSMQAGVNRVRVLLKEGRLAIHPRCSTIIAHLDGCRWDRARSEFARVTDEKGEPLHHYDGAAAAVYFVRDVDDQSNPYPAPEVRMIDRFREHRMKDTEAQRLDRLFRGRR